MMSSIRTAPAATLRRLAHLQRLLEPGAIRPVYQPIVRLSDLEAIGYEGLARFPQADGLSHMPPDVTLAAAAEVGLRGDVEVACWAAMAGAGSPPAGRLLFVNISPDALGHPGLLALAEELPSRLVIEITEQREVQDYAELRERLAPWLARGAQVAIDDTGAGYASLEHVVELRPDFLKLTRGLVADIDKDANRQALLRALGAFAREVGAVIVAEGVERVEELEVLRESDVDFAQGWLLGRPADPWPDVPAIDPPAPAPALSASTVRRLSGLERDMLLATDARAACQAVVEHLAHVGLLPAVYLEQGGRLRCVASRGYWTVHDGIAPGAGLVGRAFRSGGALHVPDVRRDPAYLASVQAVRSEACLPLRAGNRVLGVLNVESAAPIGEGPGREIERCAALLGRRLAELGPPEPPSPGQRLARAAARVSGLEEPDAVVREAAAAAMEVSGMESAVVALRDGRGAVHVQHAAGPFADAFCALAPEALAAVADWTDGGSSMLTMADASGRSLPTTEPLRQAGAGALLAVPLAAGGARLGFLAVADRSSIAPSAERAELMELLGAQVAAHLRGLMAVVELRERDARDPLTGLGHAGAFHARLPRRRHSAERAGRKVAVVLADVDGVRHVNHSDGHAAGDEVLRRMAALLEELSPPGAGAFRLGGDEFALVLDTEHRSAAQEVAWRLQARARDRLGTTVSIGVAVADAHERDADLLQRADRALHEVKRRGRDGVALAPSA